MLQAELKSRPDEDVCLIIRSLQEKLHYMCDCGEAESLTIRDCKNIKALFVSHTHIDHFCNFDSILRHQLPIGREVIICGTANMAKHVQAKLRAYNWQALTVDDQAVRYQVREILPNNWVKYYRLEAPDWNIRHLKKAQKTFVYEDEALQVRAVLLDHKIPVAAYRFDAPPRLKVKPDLPFRAGAWIQDLQLAFKSDKPNNLIEIEGKEHLAKTLFSYLEWQAGDSIAFVMDHQASPENHQKIVELCHAVDQLFIECYYPESAADLAWKNHHSTAKRSGQVAKRAGAKQIQPIHFSRRYRGEEVEALKQECWQAFEE